MAAHNESYDFNLIRTYTCIEHYPHYRPGLFALPGKSQLPSSHCQPKAKRDGIFAGVQFVLQLRFANSLSSILLFTSLSAITVTLPTCIGSRVP